MASWRLVRGTEGRLSRHVHQQLEGVWAVKKGGAGDKAEAAAGLKALLDVASTGEPWHVIIGPEDFVTNVRYRLERLFIFANTKAGLRALVFQSSPMPEGPRPPVDESIPADGPRPKNVTVYASEVGDEAREAVMLAIVSKALTDSKGGETAASIAIKGRLTALHGPLWHVLVARDAVEMGAAVEALPGTYIDARVVASGTHRVVLWQHDLPLGLFSAVAVSLPRNWATLLSVACLAIALVLTLLTQASPWLGVDVLACNLCCLPAASTDGGAAAAVPAECAGVACTAEEVEEAGACAAARGKLQWLALGFLVAAFAAKMFGRDSAAASTKARTAGAAGAGRRQQQAPAAAGAGAGKKKGKKA